MNGLCIPRPEKAIRDWRRKKKEKKKKKKRKRVL